MALDEECLRLAEALVFATAAPVTPRALSQILSAEVDAEAVITALRERYAGRGVELVDAGGGIQFRTAVDLAPKLRKVIEVPRRLPRVAMETLAIIAYHQPVTRPEIEELRGASLSQQTLDALLEANLVTPQGRRESPGRPTLWGTTPQFLTQFGLKDLRDLPRRDDLLVEPPQPIPRSGTAEAQPADQDAGIEQAATEQAAAEHKQPEERDAAAQGEKMAEQEHAAGQRNTAEQGDAAEQKKVAEQEYAAEQGDAAEQEHAAGQRNTAGQGDAAEQRHAAEQKGTAEQG